MRESEEPKSAPAITDRDLSSYHVSVAATGGTTCCSKQVGSRTLFIALCSGLCQENPLPARMGWQKLRICTNLSCEIAPLWPVAGPTSQTHSRIRITLMIPEYVCGEVGLELERVCRAGGGRRFRLARRCPCRVLVTYLSPRTRRLTMGITPHLCMRWLLGVGSQTRWLARVVVRTRLAFPVDCGRGANCGCYTVADG